MAEYILLRPTGKGGWLRASETSLPNEQVLQELVKDHPETLPLHDLGDNVPHLFTVVRESLLGNGVVDLIGVDQDGLVTVVECKLDRNPEVKRKVLGQILGYGAHLWRMTYAHFEARVVRGYFDNPARCHRSDLLGVSLADAMTKFVEETGHSGPWDEAEFHDALEDNLARGRLRLVIVVDKVNDELRRSVEFLNDCTRPEFQIVCAELKYFATETAELLADRVPISRISRALQGRATAPRAAAAG
jgi:hypothetical protein